MKLHCAPRVPYADMWDGSYNFSRSICSGNYMFGGKVTGQFIPVCITMLRRRDGKEVTMSGYQAATKVTIIGWSTSQDPPPVVVPPGDVWVGYRYLDGLWGNPGEYDVLRVSPVDSTEETEAKPKFVDSLYRW